MLQSDNQLRLLLLFAIGALQACAVAGPAITAPPRTQVVFYAMGDVPYAPAENELLPQQIARIPIDAEFVVHVGDIKSGATPCDEAVYNKVFGMLSQSAAPVFIVPGDNEWNDCTNPAQAWKYWRKYFTRFDRRWQHRFALFRQLEREENFSFVRGGVLFIGLNIVGGRVHDANEWKQRHAENLEWTRRNLRKFGDAVGSVVIFGHAKPNQNHRDFFDPFSKDAQKFAKPILYLHGDGHRWIHDKPFAAKNILRVQVDQGGIAPPLQVSITDDPTAPFVFDRRLLAAEAVSAAALEKLGARLKRNENGRIIQVNLQETHTTDAGLVALSRLRELQEISLHQTKITGAGLVHLKRLSNLKRLFLSDTAIDDRGLESLKGLRSLEILGISGTKVTDQGLEHLTGLKNLKTLLAIDAQITDAGAARLQKSLPNCDISN
jgi:hypothetical protein